MIYVDSFLLDNIKIERSRSGSIILSKGIIKKIFSEQIIPYINGKYIFKMNSEIFGTKVSLFLDIYELNEKELNTKKEDPVKFKMSYKNGLTEEEAMETVYNKEFILNFLNEDIISYLDGQHVLEYKEVVDDDQDVLFKKIGILNIYSFSERLSIYNKRKIIYKKDKSCFPHSISSFTEKEIKENKIISLYRCCNAFDTETFYLPVFTHDNLEEIISQRQNSMTSCTLISDYSHLYLEEEIKRDRNYYIKDSLEELKKLREVDLKKFESMLKNLDSDVMAEVIKLLMNEKIEMI